MRQDIGDFVDLGDAPGGDIEHAAPMVVSRRPPAVLSTRRRAAAREAARRIPFLYFFLTAAAGLAAMKAVELATWAGQLALAGSLAVGTCIATAVGVLVQWVRFRDRRDPDTDDVVQRVPEEFRRRWWGGHVAAAAWIDAVALGAAGTHIGAAVMATLLGLGAVLLGSGWMRAHAVELPVDPPPRRPLPPRPVPVAIAPPPPPPPPEPVEPVDPRHPLHVRWDERVAAGDKVVLKDAELIPLDLSRQSAKWQIDTGGDYTFDEIASNQKKIAARLKILARNVIIERDGEEEGSALLTIVLIDTVLTKDLTYPGPNYANGEIKVAMAADGTGWLTHVADDPEKGCQSGLVVGEPGAGKTAAIETIVAGKQVSGVWDVLYADGDPGGGSSHVLNAIADRAYAGKEGALRVLECLEAAIETRSHLKPRLRQNPLTGLLDLLPEGSNGNVREMHATSQYHGIAGVFDEFHRLAEDPWLKDRGFIKRIERVARIGRKYGVVLLVGTQSLLSGDFGLSTILRAILASFNAWIMRSQNQSEANALNGIAGAASTLPKDPGCCYSIGTKRTCLARFAWEPGLDRYASRFPNAPGDEPTTLAIAVAAAGSMRVPTSGDEDDAPDEHRLSIEDIVAALRTGKNPFVPAEKGKTGELDGQKPAKTQPAPAGQPAPQPRQWRTPSGASIPAPLTGKVVPMRPRPAPSPQAPVSPALRAKADRALAVLRSGPDPTTGGPWGTGRVAEETGMSLSDASKALGVLADIDGTAHRPGGKNGTYAATEHAATAT